MRLYIPLTSTDDSTKRVDRSNINLDMLKATAQKIFHPYTFDFKICDCTLPHQFRTRNNAKIFSFIQGGPPTRSANALRPLCPTRRTVSLSLAMPATLTRPRSVPA